MAAAVEGAKRGDREALHFLYVRFSPEVRRHVGTLVRDSHEVEDITQGIFLKLMSSIVRYEPRGVPFSAWLRRVARNAALDHLRTRCPTPVEEVRGSDDEAARLRRERGGALLAALEELPGDQREVMVLRHVIGMSPGEIAGLLGRTESSVHGLHHRGRQCMQNALRRAGAAPQTR